MNYSPLSLVATAQMQPVSFPAFNAFRSAAMAAGATAADHGKAITATSISETTRHNGIMRASWIMDPRNVLSIIGRTTTSRMWTHPYGPDGFDHLFASREWERINLNTQYGRRLFHHCWCWQVYSIAVPSRNGFFCRDDVRTFKICGRILGGSHKSGGCPNANRNGK
eukprot:scaffold1271_cov60-Cylindrotheca_fusiformis.AAC.2